MIIDPAWRDGPAIRVGKEDESVRLGTTSSRLVLFFPLAGRTHHRHRCPRASLSPSHGIHTAPKLSRKNFRCDNGFPFVCSLPRAATALPSRAHQMRWARMTRKEDGQAYRALTRLQASVVRARAHAARRTAWTKAPGDPFSPSFLVSSRYLQRSTAYRRRLQYSLSSGPQA